MTRPSARTLLFALLIGVLVPSSTRADESKHKDGRPEVTVIGVPKKAVMDGLARIAIDHDYSIVAMDEYRAVFEKDAGILEGALFGSRYDPTARKRLTFNVLETTEGIRVLGTLEMVTNPGSAFERRSDVSKSGKTKKQIQGVLEDLKADLEHSTVATHASGIAPARVDSAKVDSSRVQRDSTGGTAK